MKYFITILLLVFLAACSTTEDSKIIPDKFFDIRGYFEKEAMRLQKQNPVIEKTVSQNSQLEKKLVKIANWETELELFSESDINKPAWKNSYKIISNEREVEYVTSDNNLRTQKITIRFTSSGTVHQILIFNKTSNTLYTSNEELIYHPDSLYTIKKNQNVKIIGENKYSIVSRFKQTLIQ